MLPVANIKEVFRYGRFIHISVRKQCALLHLLRSGADF